MKPAPFTYIAARSPEEVVEHLAAYEGDARCLSGGQSLIPLLSYRLIQPAALIDLNRCEGLDYVRVENSAIIIGPMTRQANVEHSERVRAACPLISKTMMYLGSPTIRNRGTIGGTLAHADRTAELPAVAMALEATMVAQGPAGCRSIPASEFFLGDLTTALDFSEILREIRFPISPKSSLSAFVEASNRHHDLALVGIAVYLERQDGSSISTARVVCHGVGPQPVRLAKAEAGLLGQVLRDETIQAAADVSADGIMPEGDIHASSDYRRAILPGLVARALEKAMAEGAGPL